jgi:hypothetical protein
MTRTPLVDIGDPKAPMGSPAWCKSAHVNLCTLKRHTHLAVSNLKYTLMEFRDLERWKKLTDKSGQPFMSWEDYLQYPEPDGLGMPAASAKLVIEELDDSKLLGDVLGAHGGKRVKGQKQGDNVTLKRGNARAYILARLDRDGFGNLAAAVRAKELSANAAAEKAGFRKKRVRRCPKCGHEW